MTSAGGERILMVSPYPPIRDGIGAYAAQEVRALLLEGHDVEVLSPQPSAAHHHLRLRGARGPAALARRVTAYDRVIIQYHPDVFYPNPASAAERTAVTTGLLACCLRGRNIELRVHEFPGDWGGRGPHARLLRRLWMSARSLEVHTETEALQFARTYDLPPDRIQVVDHGTNFVARAAAEERPAIRRSLGIGDDEFVFVSIGFIQPHKGFDRAVRALDQLGRPGARLDIVGSVRVEDAVYLAYIEDLRDLVAATPGAHLHEGFVSDERFDQWLVAADVVVLPYRTIWSSSVLERARLFGTPVIATRVGGLEAQALAGATLVDDDAELAAAMAEAQRGTTPVAARSASSDGHARWRPIATGDNVDRAHVQAELRARAAGRGSGRTVRSDDVAPPGPLDPVGGRSRRAALRSLEPFALPDPGDSRTAGYLAKRVIHRLTYWQLAPLVEHVNRLHRAAVHDLGGPEAPPSPSEEGGS